MKDVQSFLKELSDNAELVRMFLEFVRSNKDKSDYFRFRAIKVNEKEEEELVMSTTIFLNNLRRLEGKWK